MTRFLTFALALSVVLGIGMAQAQTSPDPENTLILELEVRGGLRSHFGPTSRRNTSSASNDSRAKGSMTASRSTA